MLNLPQTEKHKKKKETPITDLLGLSHLNREIFIRKVVAHVVRGVRKSFREGKF